MSNLPPPPGPPGPPATPVASSWGSSEPANGWGPGAIAPHSQPTEAQARFGDGLLVGLAAAAAAAGLWWAVVAFTGYQFVYGAIAVGLLVGHGVLIGARRGGPIFGLLAAVITLASLAIAEYFIQRSLAISNEGYDIALWTDFSFAADVVREAIRGHAATGLFWGIAAVVALVTAGSSKRTPSV